MSDDKNKGMVRYEDVGDDYLEKRQLRRGAGWVLLWALGVGAVISGDFFGWNFGLSSGGFGGLAIATFLMAIMYLCLVFCIAELSAALPHAGGSYAFTRNAFGPLGGYLNGVTDVIEYVVTAAVIVVGIAGYLNALFPSVPLWVWWIASYIIFVAINIRGVELTLKVGLVITVLAMAVLVIFYVGSITSGAFDPALLLNIEPEGNNPIWLPKGVAGISAALPFAIWFYLAIEQLPLAAEETHDVARNLPKAIIWGIITLLILSLFTLVLNSGVAGGAAEMGDSLAPLEAGFRAVFGSGATSVVLTLIALTGLIASFHTIIYAYGRVLFALSRAGYFPRWISVTGRFHTPARALILGAVIGLFCAFLINSFSDTVGAALLNMAVFGAVITYALNFATYIKLKVSKPDLPRPYKSPVGIWGAVVGLVLSLFALIACFSVPAYRPGVVGTAVFLVICVVYFLAYSRNRLVKRAPEEEDALVSRAIQEIEHPHSPHMHQ
jgi:ethanolamine permease